MDFLSYSLTFNALPDAITDTFVSIDVNTGEVVYKDGNNQNYTKSATNISITVQPVRAPH